MTDETNMNRNFSKDLAVLATELVAQPHLAAGMVYELRQALQKIARMTSEYDSMSRLGQINEIANKALHG